MNLIQYDDKTITLSEINNQCRHKENVVIINDVSKEGIAVMNKQLLEKIALSSFLSKGIEDVRNGNLVNGDSFFSDLKGRLENERV